MKRTVTAIGCCISLWLGQTVAADGQRWALLIGIDGYQALGKLQYCAADARALGEVLVQRCGYDASRVVTLTDAAKTPDTWPTLANIRRRVTQISTFAERDDSVFIFFSGHGITKAGEGYLVPIDGDVQNAIALVWVKEQLNSSKAAHKILTLDACHAGAAAKGVSGIVPTLATGTGLLMLLSSAKDQVSYPDETLGHSVFSYHLLQGLAGKAAGADRELTAGELFAYVERELKAWSFRSGKMQLPVLFGSAARDMTLARYARSVDLDTPVTAAGARRPAAAGGPIEGLPYTVPGVNLALQWIPPGAFMLGSTRAERDWAVGPEGQGDADWFTDEGQNPRPTRIEQGFWLGQTEVTVWQWRQFVSATGHRTDAEKAGKAWAFDWEEGKWAAVDGANWREPKYGFEVKDEHPVACISWNDASAFCRWLTEQEKAAGRLPAGHEYRLPAECEWEYACRGGRKDSTKFWWGDSLEDGRGRLNAASDDKLGHKLPNSTWTTKFPWSDGYAFVAPVDAFGARGRNGFGLADMLGNVWEWCYDAWDESGAHQIVNADTGSRRVVRGGSFNRGPGLVRCATRGWNPPSSAPSYGGFRVCLGVCVPR